MYIVKYFGLKLCDGNEKIGKYEKVSLDVYLLFDCYCIILWIGVYN